jgi:hypothetical protein
MYLRWSRKRIGCVFCFVRLSDNVCCMWEWGVLSKDAVSCKDYCGVGCKIKCVYAATTERYWLGESILGAKPLPVPVCPSQISWTGFVTNPGLHVARPTTTPEPWHRQFSVRNKYTAVPGQQQLTRTVGTVRVWVTLVVPPIVSKFDSSTKSWQMWKIVLAVRICADRSVENSVLNRLTGLGRPEYWRFSDIWEALQLPSSEWINPKVPGVPYIDLEAGGVWKFGRLVTHPWRG